jgi:biopolymer transport protein ExbD
MRSTKRRYLERAIDEPAVNLTPLIDVVFVILIMFILVAPLLEADRIELAKASSDRNNQKVETHENSPIAIHVEADNSIYLNKRKIKVSELAILLKQEKKAHPKARPFLYHDKRAQFGTYQSVKNAVEEAGFEQMDIILKPN